MNNQDFNDLRNKDLPNSEQRLSEFTVNLSYALIAANWIFINIESSQKERFKYSMLFLGIYLFLHFIGLFFNRQHYMVICDASDQNDRKKTYKSTSYKETCWGRISNWLYYLEYLAVFGATLLFIFGAVQSL